MTVSGIDMGVSFLERHLGTHFNLRVLRCYRLPSTLLSFLLAPTF